MVLPLQPSPSQNQCIDLSVAIRKARGDFPPARGQTGLTVSGGSQPSLVVAAMATDHRRIEQVEQNGCYRAELTEPSNIDDVAQKMKYL